MRSKPVPADRPRLHAHREKSRKKTSRSLANEKPPSNKKSPPRHEGQALRQQASCACTHIAKNPRKKTSRSFANEKLPSNKKKPPRPEGQALRQQTNRVCTHIAKKSQKKTTLQLLVESIKFSTIS